MWVSKKSFFSVIFLASILGGITVYLLIETVGSSSEPRRNYISISQRQDNLTSVTPENLQSLPKGLDFEEAASQVLPGVVHIQTYYGDFSSSNPLENLFGPQSKSSGSGVIISDDGYIATNRHVIEDADRIEVVLNDNRSYFASLIGQDETTDLALLRIDERNLPFVKYGNSDGVHPGEWVLAIGNPFDLNSTVTAGIISAKARNIGILRTRSNLQIESFIQTDAAVNPGNSGGALVNLRGELIGINTAIATQNGSYQGYSFAIPVTLVRKVMDDLLEYGEVKRGLLGIVINDVDARIAEAEDLSVLNGVLIRGVNENSAGSEAGLIPGDVIVGVNGKRVTNTSELQELVARNRPGDEISITVIRGETEFRANATLRDVLGNSILPEPVLRDVIRQGTFQHSEDKKGIEVMEAGEFWEQYNFAPGDIITHVDKARIFSLSELKNSLINKNGATLIEGVNKDGKTFFRAIEW